MSIEAIAPDYNQLLSIHGQGYFGMEFSEHSYLLSHLKLTDWMEFKNGAALYNPTSKEKGINWH